MDEAERVRWELLADIAWTMAGAELGSCAAAAFGVDGGMAGEAMRLALAVLMGAFGYAAARRRLRGR